MSTAELLKLVRARGAELFIRGDELILRPASALDWVTIAEIRHRKAELLDYLRQHHAEAAPRDEERRSDARVGPWQPPGAVVPPRQCVRCGGGLQASDPDNAVCSTCLYYFSTIEPTRVQ